MKYAIAIVCNVNVTTACVIGQESNAFKTNLSSKSFYHGDVFCCEIKLPPAANTFEQLDVQSLSVHLTEQQQLRQHRQPVQDPSVNCLCQPRAENLLR